MLPCASIVYICASHPFAHRYRHPTDPPGTPTPNCVVNDHADVNPQPTSQTHALDTPRLFQIKTLCHVRPMRTSHHNTALLELHVCTEGTLQQESLLLTVYVHQH